MKKHFLFTIFCLIPFLAFSQKKSIDGFLDIPFGSDSATVKAAVAAKGGLKHIAGCEKDYLAFTGLNVGGRKVLLLGVKFVDNKAYEADLYLQDFDENQIFDQYNNLQADLTAVYGKGEQLNNFGDASNTTRIRRLKSGNASCATTWQSKNNNLIVLTFLYSDPYLCILLRYGSGSLSNSVAAKKRSDL